VNKGLIKQADFLVVGLQAAFDDLFNDMVRLAGALIAEHRLFAGHDGRIKAGCIERQRAGRRHMHRDLPAEVVQLVRLGGRFEDTITAILPSPSAIMPCT
jgi:hypothetical protein